MSDETDDERAREEQLEARLSETLRELYDDGYTTAEVRAAFDRLTRPLSEVLEEQREELDGLEESVDRLERLRDRLGTDSDGDLDPRPPTDRLAGFVAEANGLEGVEATDCETSAAVSVVGDEDKLHVDLRPVFRAAVRYGLVAFDGKGGANEVELHFKPAETAFDGESE